MFAPAISLFSTNSGNSCYIVCNVQITYENGAKVATSFVTNMDEYKIITAPKLREKILNVQKTVNGDRPEYDYPDCVLTAARLGKYVTAGMDVHIKNCKFIRTLECQRKEKKHIYGDGFLIGSEEAQSIQQQYELMKEVQQKQKISFSLSKKEQDIVNQIDRQNKQSK